MADLGHNNPPEAVELFEDERAVWYSIQIESIKSRADAFDEINGENAGDANDLIKLAGKLAKDIDAKRKEEKQPHMDAGKSVDAAYNPLKDMATKAVATLKARLAEHISEQRRIAEAARIEAERIAAEEARKAELLKADALVGESAAQDAAQAAIDAAAAKAQEKAAANVKGSEGFRAAGLRTVRKARITDSAKLVNHYSNNAQVIELCERLANADIRAAKGAAIVIPGVEIETSEVLA